MIPEDPNYLIRLARVMLDQIERSLDSRRTIAAMLMTGRLVSLLGKIVEGIEMARKDTKDD